MGALCCCPSQEDLEEYTSYPNGCIYQHCFCLRCFVHHILSMYSALFYRVEGHGVSSSIQGVASSASAGLLGATSADSSLPDTYRPPPRPLPYDADPRYSSLRRDGLVSRREKTCSHLHEESEPLRRSNSDGCDEPLTTLQKRNGADYEEQGQGYCPETSEKRQLSKSMTGVESAISLIEDEDVCPTCLDEYTIENPKISTQCGHHFHLGCIYEWMERSENCPVCDKMLEFVVLQVCSLMNFLHCLLSLNEFFEIDATRFGLRTDFIDVHNVQTLEVALKNYVIPNKTASGLTDTAEPTNGNVIVFLESITNPCIRVADVQAVSDVCKKYGAFLIVDNTFATPVRVKPIKQGADMVIHSVTKFLGGHSDLVAGVVVGTSQHIQAATKLASRWGLTAAPFDSWLASRGIRTLQVRMGRALSTTAELAKRLLCSCIPLSTKWTPDCAIMAIEVPGGLDGAKRAVSCFKLIKLAPSLGGTSTTVSHPASTSHKSLSIAERERMGISDGMLRISVGLEDVEDIWSDIKQGLAAAAAATATATANKALES